MTSGTSLIEEVMPLAALLKHLEVPGRHIRCRYRGGDAPFDAEVHVSGPDAEQHGWPEKYFVEVTSAVAPGAYLMREALNREGWVVGTSDMVRVGSRRRGDRIVCRRLAADTDEAVIEVSAWVRQCVAA